MPRTKTILQVLAILITATTLTIALPAYAKNKKQNYNNDQLVNLLVEETKRQSLNLVISPNTNLRHFVSIKDSFNNLKDNKQLLKLNDVLNTLDSHALLSGNTLKIIPLENLKKRSGKLYDEKSEIAENEWVYSVFKVKDSVCVSRLVPMLRTLLPQHAHLAQNKQHNSMIIFDQKANIDKIKGLIGAIEAHSENSEITCNINSKAS